MSGNMFTFDTTPSWDQSAIASLEDIRENPQLYYTEANIAFMIISSALILLQILGIGLVYSGHSEPRLKLSMFALPIMTAAVVGFEWYLFGYSVAFSSFGNKYWGGSDGFAIHKVLVKPSGNENGPQIPELVFFLYQGMFASFTATLVSGAAIRKAKPIKFLIFIFLWTLFVYNPIARWTWSRRGIFHHWGSYDFAGGTPVHICSGASALAYSLFFKLKAQRSRRSSKEDRPQNEIDKYANPPEYFDSKREEVATMLTSLVQSIRSQPRESFSESDESTIQQISHLLLDIHKSHAASADKVNIILGTMLLWIGWFGFNGGSALGASVRAVSACVSTHIAACTGGICYCFLQLLDDYLLRFNDQHQGPKNKGQLSIIAFCNGVVTALVCVTPAAGYIPASWSPLFGLAGPLSTWLLLKWFDFPVSTFDTLDVFALHAGPGFIGMILTGFLADSQTAHLDGFTVIPGGGINSHWSPLYKQIIDSVAGMVYSFILTFVIVCLTEIPSLWMNEASDPVDDTDIITEAPREYRGELGPLSSVKVDKFRNSSPGIELQEQLLCGMVSGSDKIEPAKTPAPDSGSP